MNPFKLLPLTITNTDVYTHLVRQPLSQAWRYFFTWFTLIGTILALNLAIFVLPSTLDLLTQAVASVQTNLPQDVTLSFTDNQLSLQPNQPINIALPTTSGVLQSALIISPTTYIGSSPTLNTFVMLGQNALAYTPDSSGQLVQVVPYQDLVTSPTSVTTAKFIPYLNSFASTLAWFKTYSLPITIMVVIIGLILMRLVQLVISCVFIYAGINLFGRRFSFKTIFTLSLYTVVLAEIIWQLSLLLYPNTLSFIYPLAFIGTLTIALLAVQRATFNSKP